MVSAGYPILSLANVVHTTIKPAQKTPHLRTIDPTFMDQVLRDAYIPTIATYRLASNSEEEYLQLLNRLKESLQKVLIPFFPFAGRWVPVYGGSERQLRCSDDGVPFKTAYVDKPLDSVVRASVEFQPVPELLGYDVLGMDVPQFKAQMLPDGLPSIFVQVTRFKCGGVVLAVTFNHMVTDAKSFYDFMIAWSDLSRTNRTDIKPDHNRGLAKSFSNIFSEVFSDAPGRRGAGDIVPAPLHATKKPGLYMWASKTFEVSASTIESLKREAKERGGYVSTVDCIVAHMWRSLSRLPSSILGGRELAAGIVVEGRTRFYDRPVPRLCGNVIVTMMCPKVPIDELLESPLSSIARKIRKKLSTTSRATWLSATRANETSKTFTSTSDKFAAWATTSWLRFPMYEIDYGFGKPFFASGPNYIGGYDKSLGSTYIGPPIPGHSSSVATVSLGSTPQVLRALEESNPDFLSFFLQHGEMQDVKPSYTVDANNFVRALT